MKKNWMFLGLIIAAFVLSRVYNLGNLPRSVYWDEASIGYNAYSVLQDGKDEWGSFLPLHFRAFGEFKLPVYIYSVAVSEKIFGLNAFAVRFPSVIFSAISLVLVYLIASKIFNKEAGLFSAFVFAFTPWDFVFSRGGYEMSAGLTFLLLGIYLFLEIKKPHHFLFVVMSFLISFYCYNSFRILVPILLTVFGISYLFKKELSFKNKITFIIFGVVISIIALIPVYRLYKYDMGSVRMAQAGVSDITPQKVLTNYFIHFSYSFLFKIGDPNLRSASHYGGELFIIDLPLILLGIFSLLFINRSKYWWLPILMLVIGPIPAAITNEIPHALRSIVMFPALSIIIGLGCYTLVNLFKNNKEVATAGILIALLISFEGYFSDYLTKYPTRASEDWQYAYEQVFNNYSDEFDNYNKIIVSKQYGQPYIFALFYLKYNPQEFRNSVIYSNLDDWGFSTVKSFGKFVFKNVVPEDRGRDVLIFAIPSEKIVGVVPSGEVKSMNGTVDFYVYK